ncbi:hypothetical protein DRP98_09165 [candidate division KSB1 bacterium]|nr:MAG: hypothetical protein DRP98_09165 [candidate division KSB1 bacterium]
MKKFNTIKVLILVAIIMIAGLSALNEVHAGMETEEAIIEVSTATGLAIEWKTYRNEKWGYLVEYPVNWSARITLENTGRPEYVIKERVSFFSPEYVEISIDVWTNSSKLDLAQWFEKKRKRSIGEDAEITRCTATALELPAICVREPASSLAYEDLMCFFQKGDRIYRIRYTNCDDNQSMEVYRHMLSTFSFE